MVGSVGYRKVERRFFLEIEVVMGMDNGSEDVDDGGVIVWGWESFGGKG